MRLFTDRSARVRLALIYSGVFLALGIALVLVILLVTAWDNGLGRDPGGGGAVPNVHISARPIGGPPAGAFIVQQHNRDIARLLVVC